MSNFWLRTARCNGGVFSGPTRFTEARESRSNRTMSKWLLLTARYKGVLPEVSDASKIAGAMFLQRSTMALAMWLQRFCIASSNGNCEASTFARASMRRFTIGTMFSFSFVSKYVSSDSNDPRPPAKVRTMLYKGVRSSSIGWFGSARPASKSSTTCKAPSLSGSARAASNTVDPCVVWAPEASARRSNRNVTTSPFAARAAM
mmetsp:Transcript_32317/g.89270  ORF Transcript_32317/g.89270 Transcript_32317/m.89270 type:complete len:203 (+) Transcript_32317:1073-1681(+)